MATFVLVHGAYQGGWIWKPVAERLRRAGHAVYAPTLDGCAERKHQLRPGITVGTHAQEVADLLFYEDLHDIVLVGTSSGGMVICRTAELAADRIARLVFVDALALMPGERIADIVKRPAPMSTELATGPTPADVEGRMFADLDPATRAWSSSTRWHCSTASASPTSSSARRRWRRSWPPGPAARTPRDGCSPTSILPRARGRWRATRCIPSRR